MRRFTFILLYTYFFLYNNNRNRLNRFVRRKTIDPNFLTTRRTVFIYLFKIKRGLNDSR